MNNQDSLQRFIFDNTDVRGEIIHLEHSYQAVLANGNYPANIQRLIGEALAASGLLSATMKFDGVFTLQARGEGDLSLLMADCTRQRLLRGIARLLPGAAPEEGNLAELLGKGHLAITVDPAQGERYQGIVPLEGETLAHCLEGYFRQSEQLPTRLWLFADGKRAGGLLLQALPQHRQTLAERDDYLDHLIALASTLNGEEFLSTPAEHLLHRLFHQETVRIYDPTAMAFACSCSRTRTERMLASLGQEEVKSIIAERGNVEIQCEFCHQQYRFDPADIEDLFSNIKTLH